MPAKLCVTPGWFTSQPHSQSLRSLGRELPVLGYGNTMEQIDASFEWIRAAREEECQAHVQSPDQASSTRQIPSMGDFDIYRTANLLMQQHEADNAKLFAAERANKLLAKADL
jgi:hypothetical protein